MSVRKDASTPHMERTAHEPRDNSLHTLIITRTTNPNPSVLLIQLSVPSQQPTESVSNPSSRRGLPASKPGQWIDLYIPVSSVTKPGGFTITSSQGDSRPFIELAVQRAPGNRVAAWLWGEDGEVGVGDGRGEREGIRRRGILGQEVHVRVGGSFVWPPCGFQLEEHEKRELRHGIENGSGIAEQRVLKKVVFVAGGVGINPLMSMLSHIAKIKNQKGRLGFKVLLLYSSKYVPPSKGEVLFLSRLKSVFKVLGDEGEFRLFLTGTDSEVENETVDGLGREESKALIEVEAERRRIVKGDLTEALGSVEERCGTFCYVCGVPGMTDWVVDVFRKAEGMSEENVLCEKWW